jgi:hypothetical protein
MALATIGSDNIARTDKEIMLNMHEQTMRELGTLLEKIEKSEVIDDESRKIAAKTLAEVDKHLDELNEQRTLDAAQLYL